MNSFKKLGLYKLDSTKMTKILGGASGPGTHSGNGQVASFSYTSDSTSGNTATYYHCRTVDEKKDATVVAPGSTVLLSAK